MASALGVDRQRYKNWEYGTSPPGQIVVMAEDLVRNASAVIPASKLPMSKVPLVGMASAGPGSDSDADGVDIWVPSHMCLGDTGAWRVEGDSMMPHLEPGDIAVVELTQQPRVGVPSLVRRPDGSLSIKIVRHDGENWVYESANQKYAIEVADGEMLGFLKGIYRVRGTYETIVYDSNGLRF